MRYKSIDPGHCIEQLQSAFIHDLPRLEFNARAAVLIEELQTISTSRSTFVPRYCYPTPTIDFLNPDKTHIATVEDVRIFHGELHRVYPLEGTTKSNSVPSSLLHRIVKTSLRDQVGYAYIAPEIHLDHYDAVFVPLGRIPIIHMWTEIH